MGYVVLPYGVYYGAVPPDTGAKLGLAVEVAATKPLAHCVAHCPF